MAKGFDYIVIGAGSGDASWRHGCRMGPGNGYVVGPDISGHGIDALSVCEASVMPTMVSGNINASVIMIAEKGSGLIRARHSKSL